MIFFIPKRGKPLFFLLKNNSSIYLVFSLYSFSLTLGWEVAFATRGFSFANRQNNLVVSELSCSQNKTEDGHVESNPISYCSQHVVVLNLS